MSEKICLVGGAGYLGSRLAFNLVNRGLKPVILDPCILCDPPDFCEVIKEDIRESTFDLTDYSVVYLATLHELPEKVETALAHQGTDWNKWSDVYQDILTDVPRNLAKKCKKFIYVSSMRSRVARSMYGWWKRETEHQLQPFHTVIRPGTIYGGFSNTLYNRTLTVPNNYALTGKLPPEDWKSYISPINKVINSIVHALSPYVAGGEVLQPIIGNKPATRDKLPVYVHSDYGYPLEKEHPNERYADYYNLPRPSIILERANSERVAPEGGA